MQVGPSQATKGQVRTEQLQVHQEVIYKQLYKVKDLVLIGQSLLEAEC